MKEFIKLLLTIGFIVILPLLCLAGAIAFPIMLIYWMNDELKDI